MIKIIKAPKYPNRPECSEPFCSEQVFTKRDKQGEKIHLRTANGGCMVIRKPSERHKKCWFHRRVDDGRITLDKNKSYGINFFG